MEVNDLKGAIIERSSGDARAANAQWIHLMI